MSKTVLRNGIFQRARDVGLADQIVERLRSIFSGKDLVTHMFNLAKKRTRESFRS